MILYYIMMLSYVLLCYLVYCYVLLCYHIFFSYHVTPCPGLSDEAALEVVMVFIPMRVYSYLSVAILSAGLVAVGLGFGVWGFRV